MTPRTYQLSCTKIDMERQALDFQYKNAGEACVVLYRARHQLDALRDDFRHLIFDSLVKSQMFRFIAYTKVPRRRPPCRP